VVGEKGILRINFTQKKSNKTTRTTLRKSYFKIKA
jgi:hypothetical protein